MPERPLLRLPSPERVDPPRVGGGAPRLTKPTRGGQGARLGPKFDRLAQVIGDPQLALQLRADPNALAAERAIVFEVAGSVEEFYERAAAIGLEYLADDEREFSPDEHFNVTGKPDKDVSGRIYLAMPDVEALRQLLSLWRRYVAGDRMQNGFGMWTKLFGLLKDVRPWGPQDRLLPETIEAWQESLAVAPNNPVRFEVELWFREAEGVRMRAFDGFSRDVRALGGTVVVHSTISEIRYDAALVDLPADRIRELLDNRAVSLAISDEIMFIRPQSVAEYAVDGERDDDQVEQPDANQNDLLPIAALLDGYPVQNHRRLQNRLVIDDPDGFEENYVLAARKHGTEMASLILHGDINRGEAPLGRRIYVRPVMRSIQTHRGWDERTPEDRLLVDLMYRSVRRLFEADGDQPAVAPQILLINISLGDPRRPFAGHMSPWARLLDYLAYRYRVLFLVSAGNISDPLELPRYANWGAFEAASIEDRERAIFEAINASKARRTIFSPAEAMNVITVGAAHHDAHNGVPGVMSIDPIGSPDLPNASSALGLGFKRIVKPEILLDGGREHVRFMAAGPSLTVSLPSLAGRSFGLRAAAPDAAGADLSKVALTWGTSGATALATRSGHRIYDALMDRDGGSTLSDAPQEFHALMIKALLVHGASWSDRAEMLEEIFDGERDELKDNVTRVLGYGALDVGRVVECTAERATLVGYDRITPGEALLYRMPLPPGLERVVDRRAVTVTLAWFSPINPRHQGYRMAALEAGPGGDGRYSLGIDRVARQPRHHALRKGTVFHDRRDGEDAVAYIDGGNMLIRVSARATAGEYEEPVPFAVAISIEVEIGSSIQVYNEVQAAIAARVRP